MSDSELFSLFNQLKAKLDLLGNLDERLKAIEGKEKGTIQQQADKLIANANLPNIAEKFYEPFDYWSIGPRSLMVDPGTTPLNPFKLQWIKWLNPSLECVVDYCQISCGIPNLAPNDIFNLGIRFVDQNGKIIFPAVEFSPLPIDPAIDIRFTRYYRMPFVNLDLIAHPLRIQFGDLITLEWYNDTNPPEANYFTVFMGGHYERRRVD